MPHVAPRLLARYKLARPDRQSYYCNPQCSITGRWARTETVLLLLCIVILHAVSLVGESAPPEMLQKLTYLAIRHHPQIKRVDTVRAYTFGVLYFVEVSDFSFVLSEKE